MRYLSIIFLFIMACSSDDQEDIVCSNPSLTGVRWYYLGEDKLCEASDDFILNNDGTVDVWRSGYDRLGNDATGFMESVVRWERLSETSIRFLDITDRDTYYYLNQELECSNHKLHTPWSSLFDSYREDYTYYIDCNELIINEITNTYSVFP